MRQDPSFVSVMELWLSLHRSPKRQEMYRAVFGRGVAAHTPAQVEEMIVRAGLAPPAACTQATLIRGVDLPQGVGGWPTWR